MEKMAKREARNSSVAIKGTKDGLLVTLGEGELSDLLTELAEHLRRTASFFKGGQVSLQVGWRELTTEELEKIKGLLSQGGVSLRGVFSAAAGTRAAARALGLQAGIESPAEKGIPRESGSDRSLRPGICVQCTLRSGQIVKHHGHIVIIGDVNPGAEVVAGGNIVIWGRLRGMVHAGAMGDDEAMVCALSLTPIQLRIGNHIARPPDEKRKTSAIPEVARVRDGKIVVEPWK